MSLLLTPIALICPLISGAQPARAQVKQAATQQEQAVCRIHKKIDGSTDVSVGTKSLSLYPIHAFAADNSYLLFAIKLPAFADATSLRMWTAASHNPQPSSEIVHQDLSDSELQLVKIPLNEQADIEHDVLCLSFDDQQMVQVQLGAS